MTVWRFWQFWGVILILEVWLILSLEPQQAPVLVRPRAAQSFPALPDLPEKVEVDPNAPPGPDATELQAGRLWARRRRFRAPTSRRRANPTGRWWACMAGALRRG